MKTIAIFGGSFNPPHLGHQSLVLMLLEACRVDEVWLVPTYRHYFGKELVGYNHRVRMCEQLVAPFGERVRVSLVESELEEPQGRMLDTLQELARRHPGHAFRLVIGADILEETNRWYRWEEVAALAPPLVFGRHGYKGGELPAPPDISSSAIREARAAGTSLGRMLPLRVLEYIEQEELYR